MLRVSTDPGYGKSVPGWFCPCDCRVQNNMLFLLLGRRWRSEECRKRFLLYQACINFLNRNVFYSLKIFLNSSKSKEKSSPAHLVSFGPSFSALQTIRTPAKLSVFWDAIDECEDDGRSQLAQALCKLYGTRNNCNLKFLLTSRPYGEIRRGFQPLEIPGVPVIHLSGESDVEMAKISREIDVFIEARVHNIAARIKLRNDEQDLLLRELMHVPNRTYLRSMGSPYPGPDRERHRYRQNWKSQSHFSVVKNCWWGILSRSRDSEKAKRILHIIVAAARPLTLREMALALTIRENHRSYSDLDLNSQDWFYENIRDICGLFERSLS